MVGEEKRGKKRKCNEQCQRDENIETLKEKEDGGGERLREGQGGREEELEKVRGEEEKRC